MHLGNLYQFVYNAGPTNLIDPDGRDSFVIIGGIPVRVRPSKPQPPHQKELEEKTTWFYTRHSLEVRCLRANYEEVRRLVYADIREFASFSKPRPNIATADVVNGVAYFDLLGKKGEYSDMPVIGNDDKVEVRLTDNGVDQTRGVTAGRHQLVGIRKWRVEKLSDKPLNVELMTHAYEHARGINFLGEIFFDARKDQERAWTTYLKNIASKLMDLYEGEVGDVRFSGPIPTAPGPNPFLPE
jgi:hypothetical protein